MNNLEKKPTKGGTPAIEKSNIVIVSKKKTIEAKTIKWVKSFKLC